MTELFEWWKAPTPQRPDVLSPEFRISDESGSSAPDLWLLLVGQQPPWHEVKVLGMLAGESSGAFFFEGIEGVTLLRRRVAWWIEGHKGVITSLIELSCICEAPQARR